MEVKSTELAAALLRILKREFKMKRLLVAVIMAIFLVSCSSIGQVVKEEPVVQVQPAKPEILPVFKEAKEKALKGTLVQGNLRASCKEMGPDKKCLIVDIKESVIALTKAEGPMMQILYFNEITGGYLIEVYFVRELIGQEVLTREKANEVAIQLMNEFEVFVDGGITI